MEDVNKRIDNLESVVRNISNKLELFLKSYSEKLEAEILEEKEKEEIRPHFETDWTPAPEYIVPPEYKTVVKADKLELLKIYLTTVNKLLE
jgi:hypothetical protein